MSPGTQILVARCIKELRYFGLIKNMADRAFVGSFALVSKIVNDDFADKPGLSVSARSQKPAKDPGEKKQLSGNLLNMKKLCV